MKHTKHRSPALRRRLAMAIGGVYGAEQYTHKRYSGANSDSTASWT